MYVRSYHTELFAGDVSNAANYDSGLFVGGALVKLTDGGGKAIASWVLSNAPNFKPKSILDIGCGVGHNRLFWQCHFQMWRQLELILEFPCCVTVTLGKNIKNCPTIRHCNKTPKATVLWKKLRRNWGRFRKNCHLNLPIPSKTANSFH